MYPCQYWLIQLFNIFLLLFTFFNFNSSFYHFFVNFHIFFGKYALTYLLTYLFISQGEPMVKVLTSYHISSFNRWDIVLIFNIKIKIVKNKRYFNQKAFFHHILALNAWWMNLCIWRRNNALFSTYLDLSKLQITKSMTSSWKFVHT